MDIIKNKKIILIIGIVLIIGIGIFVLINKNNIFKSNNKVIVTDKPIVENIEVESDDEISVVSSRIEKMGKNFSIFVKIKNNTKEVMENSKVELSILDKDNQELLKTDVDIVKRLEVGDEVEFQISSKKDISEASKYIVKRVK